jgi:uncharacterized membrane-anchored protein YhcB (DUF1043 family)
MNHPKPEDWMPYLFGETKPEHRRQLKLHLQDCPECREQVSSWERNLGRLDSWKLPTAPPSRQALQPFLTWAAAAAALIVFIASGFVFGRITASGSDARKIQAAIEPQLRQQMRQEFAQMLRQEMDKSTAVTLSAAQRQAQQLVTEYDQSLSANRSAEVQAIYAALDKLAARHASDFISLKKDVDTVAVMTDAGLRRTEQQLVQFADYTQPSRPSNSPQK